MASKTSKSARKAPTKREVSSAVAAMGRLVAKASRKPTKTRAGLAMELPWGGFVLLNCGATPEQRKASIESLKKRSAARVAKTRKAMAK